MEPCETCGDGRPVTGRQCIGCANKARAAWQARMKVRMDTSQFDPDKLVRLLLDQHWMHEVEIVAAYLPPHPRPDTRPRCVARYRYDDGQETFLRHSAGPLQGYFWDVYGDDLHTPELALIAISRAPAPPRVHAVMPTHGT